MSNIGKKKKKKKMLRMTASYLGYVSLFGIINWCNLIRQAWNFSWVDTQVLTMMMMIYPDYWWFTWLFFFSYNQNHWKFGYQLLQFTIEWWLSLCGIRVFLYGAAVDLHTEAHVPAAQRGCWACSGSLHLNEKACECCQDADHRRLYALLH